MRVTPRGQDVRTRPAQQWGVVCGFSCGQYAEWEVQKARAGLI